LWSANSLTVSVSTGGIIALGLGVKQWSVYTCGEKFINLCEEAFTPREGHGIWGLEYAATLKHGSKWATTPLHRALQSEFGDEHLFGGIHQSDENYRQKVAVIATSGTAQQAIVLPNYNRQEQLNAPYVFEFAHMKKLGMELWEAACATSAAPSYFKPFKSAKTDRVYLDGALYYNNPVEVSDRERKLIWSDVADRHPDVVISIGTGQNTSRIRQQVANEMKSDNYNIKFDSPKIHVSSEFKRPAWKRFVPGKLAKAFELLVCNILPTLHVIPFCTS
jgi:predicted acylesterase/phospholipase RssA